ncbi:serine hydrolase domain-containing protein [Pelagibacterium halotolerans]|uniref:serine hydrolase domain-containing protein n=1 Tax=Pelagibacterium halotolerans TaxID=531813 RepID=UPI0038506BBB
MNANRRRFLKQGAAVSAFFAAGCLPAAANSHDERAVFEMGCDVVRGVMNEHVMSGYVPGLTWAVDWEDHTRVEAAGAMAFGGAPMHPDSIFRIASVSKPITAAAAMVLVDDGKIDLDDPVDRYLPELANRRVLRSVDGPLDDTVPARRAITLRDLLTFRFGLGALASLPESAPIRMAMAERDLEPGEEIFPGTSDEYMRRMSDLPLAYQPGEVWLYHTGSEVAGVLVERVAGKPLGAFMNERIFSPLGMKGTGFYVTPANIGRLVTAYMPDASILKPTVFDAPIAGRFSKPPLFESGGGGLVSTAGDCLAFYSLLANEGGLGGVRVLSRQAVAAMTSNQLTPEQMRAVEARSLLGGDGWGLGVSVQEDGSFGWIGSYGTVAFCDPAQRLTAILMTQRLMDLESSDLPPTMRDFYAASTAFTM